MKTKTDPFQMMPWLREVRDRLAEELSAMNPDEQAAVIHQGAEAFNALPQVRTALESYQPLSLDERRSRFQEEMLALLPAARKRDQGGFDVLAWLREVRSGKVEEPENHKTK